MHKPVLLEDVLNFFSEISPEGYFLDGTFGRGGHATALMERHPGIKMIGLDRDHEAIDYANEHYSQLISDQKLFMCRGNFTEFKKIKKQFYIDHNIKGFDGILLDLGVSSPQLDEGIRGFSFYHDGPLDMRMDHSESLTAADIVNTWTEEDLTNLFKTLGEIRSPYRVVEKILEFRQQQPFETTQQLSKLVQAAIGWKKKGVHPATQYFLALRLKINQEIELLEKSLIDLIEGMNPGARLAVITFHSLEDRIVKYAFKGNLHLGKLVNKKVVQATWEAKKKNPRARSAKLRVFERGENLEEKRSN